MLGKHVARTRMHKPTRPGTHTHARTEQYILFIAFPLQELFVNGPQCYVIRPLSALFHLIMILIFCLLKC